MDIKEIKKNFINNMLNKNFRKVKKSKKGKIAVNIPYNKKELV